jgi:hypothetical protein
VFSLGAVRGRCSVGLLCVLVFVVWSAGDGAWCVGGMLSGPIK